MANLAPAFAQMHAALLPALSTPPLAAGQSATVRGLVLALGVAGYLDEASAARMAAEGQVVPVAGAPVLTQPIHAALHLRNRHRPVWRRLVAAMRQTLESRR